MSAPSPPHRPAAERLRWPDDNTLVLDGSAFEVRDLGGPTHHDRLRLMKPRQMIERYVDLLTRLDPRTIVELGIYQGGSTAFLGRFVQPERLVALDISPDRVPLLDAFLADHHLQDTVRLHYGTDQTDTAAITRILSDDLAGRAPDLVVDDASHDLELTRRSFEILFPALAPGGTYIIEDWAWGLFPFSPTPTSPSLSVLVYELLLTLPFSPELIDDVTVNVHWAAVRKSTSGGPDAGFRLADAYSPYGHRIVAGAVDGARPDAP